MWKTRKLFAIAGLFAVIGFVLGVTYLFVLRFETGDVYPVYSSLRADPLGTKAFYESLRDTGQVAVERNYGPLDRIPQDQRFTLLCLGASASSAAFHSPALIESLHALVLNGARLVLTISPSKAETSKSPRREGSATEPRIQDRRRQKDSARPPAEKDRDKVPPPAPPGGTFEALRVKWQAAVSYDRARGDAARADVSPVYAETGLPPVLPWHSAAYFADLAPAWRIVYQSGDRPLVVERSLGQGTIVLMTDTFLLSNEALRDERYPRLLSFLIGPHAHVIFEETHLGLRQQPGVAALTRRIRLHWPLAALLLLALLFVWKNAVPFIPPPEDFARTGHTASAKDYTEGLISLLRRSIAGTQILETMVTQWQKDLPRNRPLSETRQQRIRAALDGPAMSARGKRDPVAAYAVLYQLITRKNDEN